METIQAKEVIYMGFRFRSLTEAMWASFFQYMRIKFKYEPGTFLLPNGMKYLPDFYLGPFYAYHGSPWHGKNLWAEVKGVDNEQDLLEKSRDVAKVKSFSGLEQHDRYSHLENPVIILPSFPHSIGEWLNSNVSTFEFIDGDFFPCAISKNDYDDNELVLCGDDSNYWSLRNYELTNCALMIAWMDYEHGLFKEVKTNE